MKHKSKTELTTALLQCQSIANSQARNVILRELSPDIQYGISRSDVARIDVRNIIDACGRYPKGLQTLVELIRDMEGDSFSMREVDRVMSELSHEIAQPVVTNDEGTIDPAPTVDSHPPALGPTPLPDEHRAPEPEAREQPNNVHVGANTEAEVPPKPDMDIAPEGSSPVDSERAPENAERLSAACSDPKVVEVFEQKTPIPSTASYRESTKAMAADKAAKWDRQPEEEPKQEKPEEEPKDGPEKPWVDYSPPREFKPDDGDKPEPPKKPDPPKPEKKPEPPPPIEIRISIPDIKAKLPKFEPYDWRPRFRSTLIVALLGGIFGLAFVLFKNSVSVALRMTWEDLGIPLMLFMVAVAAVWIWLPRLKRLQ